ncbi:MAG: oligosaccharide flippase family protein, partial [Longimicrobiales bacterium]|nr:oligosaccharide flippase family protein [Longimicrobiales bacterium]
MTESNRPPDADPGERARGRDARTSSEDDTRDLARGAGVNYLGSVARILPRVAFLVLAGRLYGEEGFGAYTFGVTVVETAAALALFGMKRSIFGFMSAAPSGEASDGEGVHRPVATGIALAATIGLALSLTIGFAGGALARSFGLPSAVEPLRILTLAVPLIVASDILLVAIRFTRQMRWEVYARSLIEPITLTLALVVLHAAGVGESGLAWAYVLSLLAAALSSVVFFTRVFSLPTCLRVRLRWSEIRELATFSGPTAGYELGLMLADKIDIFLVSWFGSVGTVGIYGMARQFATVTKKIRGGFDRILPPVFSESLATGEMSRADRQLTMVVRWILTAELLVALIFVVYGETLLGSIEASFAAGAGVVVILMLADAIHGSLGLGELPFVYLRPWPNVAFGLALLALTGGLGVWWIPALGAEGAALSVLASVTLVNGVRVFASRRWLGMAVADLTLLKPAAAAAVTALVILGINRFVDPAPVLELLLGLPLLLALFGGVLHLLGLEPEDRAQLARIT